MGFDEFKVESRSLLVNMTDSDGSMVAFKAFILLREENENGAIYVAKILASLIGVAREAETYSGFLMVLLPTMYPISPRILMFWQRNFQNASTRNVQHTALMYTWRTFQASMNFQLFDPARCIFILVKNHWYKLAEFKRMIRQKCLMLQLFQQRCFSMHTQWYFNFTRIKSMFS